jgi:hypothetical protein
VLNINTSSIRNFGIIFDSCNSSYKGDHPKCDFIDSHKLCSLNVLTVTDSISTRNGDVSELSTPTSHDQFHIDIDVYTLVLAH